MTQEVFMDGHRGDLHDAAWHPAVPELFASASDDHTVLIWSAVEKRVILTCDVGFKARKVAFSSAPRTVFAPPRGGGGGGGGAGDGGDRRTMTTTTTTTSTSYDVAVGGSHGELFVLTFDHVAGTLRPVMKVRFPFPCSFPFPSQLHLSVYHLPEPEPTKQHNLRILIYQSSHPLTVSPSHRITLSPSHPLTLSPSLPLTLSPSHPLTL